MITDGTRTVVSFRGLPGETSVEFNKYKFYCMLDVENVEDELTHFYSSKAYSKGNQSKMIDFLFGKYFIPPRVKYVLRVKSGYTGVARIRSSDTELCLL